MFGEPIIRRSLHGTAAKDISRKKKMQLKKSVKKKVGNIATIVLNPYDFHASRLSIIRGIRKGQAWCRIEGNFVDLSDHLGENIGIYTTPADGTFHLTVQYMECELTFHIYGRNLYVKGWTGGKFGLLRFRMRNQMTE